MWVLAVDVAVVVLGLAVLALLSLRLWRQVTRLGRSVGAAGERISALTSELDAISAPARARADVE